MAPTARRKAVSDLELKALLSAEISAALGYLGADDLSGDRAKANRFYKGDLSTDLPAPGPGRSKAVSSDVQDAIEGTLPSLIEILTGGDEVARFEPFGPEDEEAAQQETDYINYVFYQKNDGFLVVHDSVKDALLNKTGIIKVWWDKTEEVEVEDYENLTAQQLGMLMVDPEVEVTQVSTGDDFEPQQEGQEGFGGTVQAKIKRTKTSGCARVEAVAPEEFLCNKKARSNDDKGFRGQLAHPTQADLISLGCDREKVEKLETWTGSDPTAEATDRDTVRESDGGATDDLNREMRQVEIVEAIIRVDRDGDGIAERRKILTSKDGQVILLDELDDTTTFIVGSPIRIAHRIIGRSMADQTIDIQLINTAIMRQWLDNMYQTNNARLEVPDAALGENTIADLLSTIPGHPIRTKAPGMLQYIQTPSLAAHAMPLLEYIEGRKENRTGVTRYNQGVDADSLNKTARGVSMIMSASQMRTRLIARMLAETMIKPALLALHRITLKYGRKAETVRLRNKWVDIDPSEWKERSNMTVSVALGTGSRDMNIAHLQSLIGVQGEIAKAMGPTGIVSPQNVFNTAAKLTEAMGYKAPEQFFTDPTTQPPKPPPPNPEMEKVKIEAMAQQAELVSKHRLGQMEIENKRALGEAEIQTRREVEMMKTQGDMAMQAKQQQTDAQAKTFEIANQKFNPQDGTPNPVTEIGNSLVQALVQAQAESNAQLQQSIAQMGQQLGEVMEAGFSQLIRVASADRVPVKDHLGKTIAGRISLETVQ